MDHGFLENLLEFWVNPQGITFYFGVSIIGIKANKEACPQKLDGGWGS